MKILFYSNELLLTNHCDIMILYHNHCDINLQYQYIPFGLSHNILYSAESTHLFLDYTFGG
jgi:hypothetical protein